MGVPLEPVFRVRVSGGRFGFYDREKFDAYLRGRRDGDYVLQIRKPRRPKSRLEENYYWPVCVALWAEHQGYSRKEAHEDLLLECAEHDEDGNLMRTSDSRMTRAMYHFYVERCREFMAREGCPTPDPGEVIEDWNS